MSILVDFEDIYTAICEELKVPTSDGVTLSRIKRDINMIYLNHVVPFKLRSWEWLEQKENIVTYEKYDTGTITLETDSTTITFSTAPTISLTGYQIKATGYPSIVKISSHTADSTTATIETAWHEDDVTDGGFKAWKDYCPLSATMKDVVIITHDRRSVPLDALYGAKFTEIRARFPEFEGYPQYFHLGDQDSDGCRVLRWFPACSDTKVTLHVEGRQEAPALSADADEPLMPVEDRIVIFYGACSRAWARERNESESVKNWNLFLQKLNEMAAKSGAAPQVTEIETDRDYLIRKRYRRYNNRGYGNFESE